MPKGKLLAIVCACSHSLRQDTGEAPWYVVPADDKENARLIVSQIILDTLNGLKMAYPEVSAKRRQELQSIRERLTNGDLD